MLFFKNITLATLLLAFIVVGLGSYVRLSDAGLGCPDWPGCYGHLIGVPDEIHEQITAKENYPDSPVEVAKAWKEVIHRYFASGLGLLILIIFIQAIRLRKERLLAGFLLAVVCYQGALGMWTVTLLLKPAIVTAHLLGGMLTLGLLVSLYLRLSPIANRLHIASTNNCRAGLRALALFTLIAVFGQITLGGWVSTNYAALACQGFPSCNGSYSPIADYEHAFVIQRELGQTAQGDDLSNETLIAIHWLHRIGALFLSILVLMLSWKLYSRHRAWSLALFTIFAAQILFGIINVIFVLPMAIAVAHNLGAATLMSALILINFSLMAIKTHSLTTKNAENR